MQLFQASILLLAALTSFGFGIPLNVQSPPPPHAGFQKIERSYFPDPDSFNGVHVSEGVKAGQ